MSKRKAFLDELNELCRKHDAYVACSIYEGHVLRVVDDSSFGEEILWNEGTKRYAFWPDGEEDTA